MARAPKVIDAQVAAANNIYQVAQEEANRKLQALQEEVDDVRQEAFAQGAIRALDSSIAYNELLKHVTLYNIKKHKDYRKGGLTWDDFCESIGLERRNVDRVLDDVAPLVKEFSDRMSVFCGIPFNKIRHLGRSLSGNLSEIKEGAICYGGETIPITPEHADEIQALIDVINEDAKNAKDEAEATIKAKDRVLQSKEQVIKKQEKELIKLARESQSRDMSPEEDAFLQRMENLRLSFDGYLLKADPDVIMNDLEGENVTPRMRASMISTLAYMRMQVLAAFDTAVTNYGDPSMTPEVMEDFQDWVKSQANEQQ